MQAARSSLVTHEQPSLGSPGMVKHRSEAQGEINLGRHGGTRRGGVYAYESGNGTYLHTSDGARVPLRDVAIEIALSFKQGRHVRD